MTGNISDSTATLDDAAADHLLRAALSQISSGTARWSDPGFADLFAIADRKLRATARRNQADTADAISHAFELWAENPQTFIAAASPWALTVTLTAARLAGEGRAQRLQTSTAAFRRQGFATAAEKIRHGELTEELLELPASAVPDDTTEFRTIALRRVHDLLVEAGYPHGWAFDTVNTLLNATLAVEWTGTGMTIAKAAKTLREDKNLPARLGIPAKTVNDIVGLVFCGTTGDRGLIQAERDGVNPASVKNIRNASKRLLALAM